MQTVIDPGYNTPKIIDLNDYKKNSTRLGNNSESRAKDSLLLIKREKLELTKLELARQDLRNIISSAQKCISDPIKQQELTKALVLTFSDPNDSIQRTKDKLSLASKTLQNIYLIKAKDIKERTQIIEKKVDRCFLGIKTLLAILVFIMAVIAIYTDLSKKC